MPPAEPPATRDAGPGSGRRGGAWRVVLAFFAGLALVIGVAAVAIHRVAVQPAVSLPDRIAGALAKITQAKVVISSNSVTVAQSDVTELAVVSRQTQTLVKYESEVLGSGNVLIVRGDFVVKAGFDLTEPFSVRYDQETGAVEPQFPPAEVLSVEMSGYEVIHAQDGLWNRLRAEHQETVTRRLLQQAKLDAEKSDIRQEAESKLATRLLDLLGHPPAMQSPPPDPAPVP